MWVNKGASWVLEAQTKADLKMILDAGGIDIIDVIIRLT